MICVDLDTEAAEKVAADVGGDAFGVDVADRAAMQSLADEVHDRHGPLGVLVNNAGIGHSGQFAATPLDDWDRIVGVNLMGVVHGCRMFGPAMADAGRGHVVNVASGLAYFHRATEPLYCTTKAAVLTLSRCLRAEWSDLGVGVTAVCPGVIDTPIVHHTTYRGAQADPERVAKVHRTFRRRGHSPDRVASAVISAIAADRPVAPVGAEAWAGWYLSRWMPTRLGDRAAASSILDS